MSLITTIPRVDLCCISLCKIVMGKCLLMKKVKINATLQSIRIYIVRRTCYLLDFILNHNFPCSNLKVTREGNTMSHNCLTKLPIHPLCYISRQQPTMHLFVQKNKNKTAFTLTEKKPFFPVKQIQFS